LLAVGIVSCGPKPSSTCPFLEQEQVEQVDVAEAGLPAMGRDVRRGHDRQRRAQDLRQAEELVRHGAAQQRGVAVAVETVVAADVAVSQVDADARGQGVLLEHDTQCDEEKNDPG